MISANDLALYIIARLGRASQLKVQKLLYYIEAWHLVYFDRSIINEDIQAWVHGPVIRSVWDSFKEKSPLWNDISIKPDFIPKIIQRAESQFTQDQKELIDDVLKEYGDKTAYYLEDLSHSERPWKEARKGMDPSDRSEVIISKQIMKEYYQSLNI